MALYNFWRMPWSTLTGTALGVAMVFVTPQWVGPVRDFYDSHFPVLKMSGTVVGREPDSVLLHITGEKIRGEECRLLQVYGYSVMTDGRLADATATRVDMIAVGRPRGPGFYDIGVWRVKPIGPEAVGVKVVAQHDCLGRLVLSTIAEAKL
jgi:hypothetical protein